MTARPITALPLFDAAQPPAEQVARIVALCDELAALLPDNKRLRVEEKIAVKVRQIKQAAKMLTEDGG